MVPVADCDRTCKNSRAWFATVFFEARLIGIIDSVRIDPASCTNRERVMQCAWLGHD